MAAPWSESVEVEPGCRLLFVSGQVPPIIDTEADPESRGAYGDMEMQTRGVLDRLALKLEAAGFGLEDVVKLQGHLVGEERFGGRPDLEGFGRAYRERFAAALPARTRVQVDALMNPAWLVEIEAIAAKREEDRT